MIDWNTTDTVLLDMDGTLLDLHFDNYFWQNYLPLAYAKKHHLSKQQAEEDLFSRFEAMQGTLDWYCLDFWTKELSLDILALKREIQHLIQLRPYALEFLQGLQQSNKRCLLVTNAHPSSVALKMLNTRLTPFFDVIVSSHDLGYPKESQKFWKALQDQEDFLLERTVFIDDTESILKAADIFGISTVLGVRNPDSQRESPPELLNFPLVSHFLDVMP